MTLCGCWSGRDSGERPQQEALADRTGASSRERSVGRWVGWLQAGCEAGSGRARSRARARVNWVSHGQCCGRCSVRRRAERVSRPARAKTRRLSVLVVTTCSPRPIRAVQRARLWAITCTASQAPLAAKRPDGGWLRPNAVLQVPDGILDLGVAAVVGLQFEHLPVPAGDEAVIAAGGEESQLGTGRGLHTPDDEPHRRGVRLTLEGDIEPVPI